MTPAQAEPGPPDSQHEEMTLGRTAGVIGVRSGSAGKVSELPGAGLLSPPHFRVDTPTSAALCWRADKAPSPAHEPGKQLTGRRSQEAVVTGGQVRRLLAPLGTTEKAQKVSLPSSPIRRVKKNVCMYI